MRTCLQLSDGSGLMALKGGASGMGEIALCLPQGLLLPELHTSWAGLNMGEFRRTSDPETLYLTLGPQDAYRHVFTLLCEDLMETLARARNSLDVQELTFSHLSLWSGFLQQQGGEPDARTVRGLYGELRFLEDLLVPAVGWRTALQAWTGPTGAPNDVVLPGVRVEVKTTTPEDQMAVISSLEQLDPPGQDGLWLAQALMHPDPEGETLADLLIRLKASAHAVACAGLLQARVDQTGVSPDTRMCHQLICWQLHRADSETFPRLLRQNLLPGIRQCTYRIDLAGYQGVRPDSDQLRLALRNAGMEFIS